MANGRVEPVHVILPHPDGTAIARLYLERLPELTTEERRLYFDVLTMLCYPPIYTPTTATP